MEGLIVVKKVKKKDARVVSEQVLEKVGLSDKLHFYPSQLSGGSNRELGLQEP